MSVDGGVLHIKKYETDSHVGVFGPPTILEREFLFDSTMEADSSCASLEKTLWLRPGLQRKL
jgi:hypothetical protein